MAYDEKLDQRISATLDQVYPDGLVKKKMFGGVCYLVHGNMAVGVHGHWLIVRVGVAAYAQALRHPHVRPFDLTGKPMKGWVTVGPEGYARDEDLAWWMKQGLEYARSLPAK